MSLVDTRDSHRCIDNVVGNAFLQLLAETDGRDQDQRFVLESPFSHPTLSRLSDLGLLFPGTKPALMYVDANNKQ